MRLLKLSRKSVYCAVDCGCLVPQFQQNAALSFTRVPQLVQKGNSLSSYFLISRTRSKRARCQAHDPKSQGVPLSPDRASAPFTLYYTLRDLQGTCSRSSSRSFDLGYIAGNVGDIAGFREIARDKPSRWFLQRLLLVR